MGVRDAVRVGVLRRLAHAAHAPHHCDHHPDAGEWPNGSFSTRLRPGKYTILATSPAYNDGRAQCALRQPVVVGNDDVSGITIVRTER